jgi:hypothetical protein
VVRHKRRDTVKDDQGVKKGKKKKKKKRKKQLTEV